MNKDINTIKARKARFDLVIFGIFILSSSTKHSQNKWFKTIPLCSFAEQHHYMEWVKCVKN